MSRIRSLGITLLITILSLLVLSQTAYGSSDAGILDQAAHGYYIDPGTGSIIIQVAIGALVAGLGMIGVYRARVAQFFRNLIRRRKGDEESD